MYRKLRFAALLLLGNLAYADDFQLWLYNMYERPVSKKERFSVFIEGRWGEDASRLLQTVFETEILRRIDHNFEIGPGFRNIWNFEDDFPDVHLLFVDSIFRIPIYYGEVRNRFRPEYAMIEDEDNLWVIRNRIGWFLPLCKRFTSFVEDEFFWNEEDGFFENRVYLGGAFELKWNFRGDLFYMRRVRNRDDFWEHDHVLGIRLRYICR